MKSNKFLTICLLAFAICASSCADKPEDKEKYPMTTVIGEQTCVGKIVFVPIPPFTDPPLPGVVLGLETESGDYVLSSDEHRVDDETVTVGDVVYSIDDEVRITGTVSVIQISESKEYAELEIKTIERVER